MTDIQIHNHEGHNHSHTTEKAIDIEKRLSWALVITIGIFLLEIVGGILSNSLALKSDAGHLFGDVLALGLSLFATRISRRPPTFKRTYGYHRTEVLAAVVNGVTLFFLAGFIFVEAYHRLLNPQPVRSILMLVVAVIGLIANLVVMSRLHDAAGENLNVRAAFLHVVGDMLGSVGVVAGGLIMIFTGNYLADPIISFFVGAIILWGAVGVMREGAHILLESVPRSINYNELKESMEKIEGVISVHDLHIWTISSSNLALSAHINITNQSTHESGRILRDEGELLSSRYNIHHATLQLECDCCTGTDCGCISP
jgi:cobalt-zinc-cadmium efflux system protein